MSLWTAIVYLSELLRIYDFLHFVHEHEQLKSNEHKKSRLHKVAVEVQLYVMKQGTISSQLDEAMLNSHEQWRSFLVKVITDLKFLGECALPV